VIQVRRSIQIALVLSTLVVGVCSTARAQGLHEILAHRVSGITSNPFGCPSLVDDTTEQPCNLWNRIYGDKAPILINSPSFLPRTGSHDGFPRYGLNTSRYLGDGHTTGNYSLISADDDACEAWYSVWDGVVDAERGTFVTYYGASSAIVNFVDSGGDSGRADCSGEDTSGTVCLGALGPDTATGSSPGTPAGDLVAFGGLEPVPVPRVAAVDTGGGSVRLEWSRPANQTTANRASLLLVACPSTSTFDDLTATSAPPPIRGMRLFVHLEPPAVVSRNLPDLEGGTLTPAGFLDRLGGDGSRICRDDGDCPGSHVVPCRNVAQGECTPDGIDFLPTAQSVLVHASALDQAVGPDGPLSETAVAVFNLKIVYAGARITARPDVPAARLNPSLVSLFSANSSKVAIVDTASDSTLALGTDVGIARATSLTVRWSADGGPFVEFRLSRSIEGEPFVPLAVVPATGQVEYVYGDVLEGPLPSSVLYKVEAQETGGRLLEATQAYEFNEVYDRRGCGSSLNLLRDATRRR
jgi:hypothetical protein